MAFAEAFRWGTSAEERDERIATGLFIEDKCFGGSLQTKRTANETKSTFTERCFERLSQRHARSRNRQPLEKLKRGATSSTEEISEAAGAGALWRRSSESFERLENKSEELLREPVEGCREQARAGYQTFWFRSPKWGMG